MNEREKLIEELERIADKVCEGRNIEKMKLEEASEDVQKWVNGIVDFILADRKSRNVCIDLTFRDQERFRKIIDEAYQFAIDQTLKNAGEL